MSQAPVEALLVTSRRRQYELLRSWSGWTLIAILTDPAEVTRLRESGWAGTHHQTGDSGARIHGSPAGLGFGVNQYWQHPTEVIPWTEVIAVASSVPRAVRARLDVFRARWHDHQRVYPRFAASADAAGCGPFREGVELTERQQAYLRELHAFYASGVLPAWEKQKAALDAEWLSMRDEALPLANFSEAGDLLELLADQHNPGADSQQPRRGDATLVSAEASGQVASDRRAGEPAALRPPPPDQTSTGAREVKPVPPKFDMPTDPGRGVGR